ncbi:Protein of unknown function [Lutibacter agarilyticus]|uniref:DUF3987 domain-containing protein n=1 Tax=Lutibacter agarilyticus TaxID=1109740 RepID=A0A238WHZ5_9FLAO|nr:DUF3987 domain-containing protein [Lutibacter agarilyticus]SNR46078.1 Protein of unknown function [Lutibacter agarilyticus]
MSIETIEGIEDNIDNLVLSNKERSLSMLYDIINQLPTGYSDMINQTFKHKRVPKEYLLTSILYTISTSIGLTFFIKALGYKNYANLYFTLIGSRGDTKSEAMKIAIDPLKDIDDMDYDLYKEDLKNCNEDSNEPERKQLLIQNASIEAVHKIHSENPNSVGISIDEIYSLIEKMGNSSSRDGVAWRTFFLEGYTNGHVDISRKTTKSFRIKETYPTLLGGLQHQFIPKLFANGNLESGFIDRQLFTPKLTKNNELSRGQISFEVIDTYNRSILNIIAYKRQSEKPEELTKQFKIELSKEAEDKLFDYSQNLIFKQQNAEPIIKEYMSKMQISIHKFCLLAHMMKKSIDSDFRSILELETVELAIKFNEFYFINFKIIIEENLSQSDKEPTLEQIIKLAKKNNASQKAVAEVTGFHKGTISKKWPKGVSNQQLATSNTLKNTG